MNQIARRDTQAYHPVFGLLDRMFDTPFAVFGEAAPAGSDSGNLAIDVSEEGNDFVVRASLPGFAKEDVAINIEDGVVTIKAQHREEKEETGERFYRRERRFGSMSRRVALPGAVDETKTKAELKDGVLTLRAPKAHVARSKAISVQ